MSIAADLGMECFTAESHASRAYLETINAITFTDEDIEVEHPDHRRPLYLMATINGVQVRRALVNTGASLNLIVLSTSEAVGLTGRRILGAPMEITGFGGLAESTEGYVQLALRVGPIVALTRFHVINSEVSYHVLLGRLWLYKHHLIPSTYHQCVKGRLNGKPVRIPANHNPFSQGEVNFMETMFYDELEPDDKSPTPGTPGAPVLKKKEGGNNPRSQETAGSWVHQAHSTSQVASNIVPVKKRNGQIRCCVDFRNLNKACTKDEFPLPNIDLLVDSIVGSSMFSFMDGYSGHNQIRMATKDAEKTAFRTPIGNFYYTVIPFGLKNARATYQRTMIAIFIDMMHKEMEDYVDDVVVKSKTKAGHLQVLEQVFERCRTYKLRMNPMKCAFGMFARKFLGFLVHHKGISVDPAKAMAIATMKRPTQGSSKASLGGSPTSEGLCQD
ncbi:uncharacterized protein LOC142634638 [Castanea sativa]|uniref:uncharacterized protein LOC142634638 n=1 Tax=Castanea sativa TaxID=21020 RepID=UPI003F64A849